MALIFSSLLALSAMMPAVPVTKYETILVAAQYRCSELTYEEAQQLLKEGHEYLDRNNDGIACNGNRRR